jgi:BirA family transcriptional regulator, biotin operon repressor / biotin---[acetyl-CoA-carboxylase] ligase
MNVLRIPSTPSTQDEARRLVRAGIAEVGDVILAEEQTSGRGRFGRTWVSPTGGLYATIVCESNLVLSLKAGLAVAHALRRAGVGAFLKWPNDVQVDGRKIAGILIEQSDRVAYVGIGLNLLVSPLHETTCVGDHLAEIGAPIAWAVEIAGELRHLCAADFDPGAYQRLSSTLGRHVRIDHSTEGTSIAGLAAAIGLDGTLLLDTDQGRRRITTGDCRHVEVEPDLASLRLGDILPRNVAREERRGP